MLSYINHTNLHLEGVDVMTVCRGQVEVAELLKAKNGFWYMWKTLNPLWSGLELREIADKLDILNSGVRDEVQVPISGGDTQ